MTPFGSPVVPDVYMITARSSGFGGAAGTSDFIPSVISLPISSLWTPAFSRAFSPASITAAAFGSAERQGSGMKITFLRCFICERSFLIAPATLPISFASSTISGAFVCAQPWSTPSSPSVA